MHLQSRGEQGVWFFYYLHRRRYWSLYQELPVSKSMFMSTPEPKLVVLKVLGRA